MQRNCYYENESRYEIDRKQNEKKRKKNQPHPGQ
jgi:hypothetical protein